MAHMTSGKEPFSAVCTVGVLVISHQMNRIIGLPLVVMSDVEDEPGWQT